MLVLSRKVDQSILIGDGIEIKVVQIRGSGPGAQVRLGIVAPPGVVVLRKEIYDAVREENLRAAGHGSERADAARLARLFAPGTRAEAGPGGSLDGPHGDGAGDG